MNDKDYESYLKRKMKNSLMKPETFLLIEICKLLHHIAKK